MFIGKLFRIVKLKLNLEEPIEYEKNEDVKTFMTNYSRVARLTQDIYHAIQYSYPQDSTEIEEAVFINIIEILAHP